MSPLEKVKFPLAKRAPIANGLPITGDIAAPIILHNFVVLCARVSGAERRATMSCDSESLDIPLNVERKCKASTETQRSEHDERIA